MDCHKDGARLARDEKMDGWMDTGMKNTFIHPPWPEKNRYHE